MAEKIVLVNDLSPGDILISSVAIRSLHKAYPGRFLTDVRSPCNDIFENNPYVTKLPIPDPLAANRAIEELKKDENHPPIMVGDTKYVISHYPEIHRSGMTGLCFADGHRMFLEKQLGISIPRCGMKPDIFFSPKELALPRMVEGKYWIINAGIKNDYTLKWYNHHQEVVNLLKDRITFVQIGLLSHNHPALDNVIDLRGKTSLRQLFLLSNYADGAICCVSLQMVIMAALSKPCVVISGAREGVRWQLNPDHRFLYTNGAMKCATYDGCWKSKKEECVFKSKDNEPMCLELIRPEDVARAVELYYLGGRLTFENNKPEILDIPNLMGKFGQAAGKRFNEIVKEAKMDNQKKEGPAILDLNNQTANKKQVDGGCGSEVIKMEEIPEFYRAPQINSAIFNTLRILKKLSPTDTYLEAYLGHYAKRQEKFMDTYHFMWFLGSVVKPRRILEIGSRTGISICQLLSAYVDHSIIENVVLCDLFNDGLGTPDLIFNNLKYLNIPTDKVQFLVGDSLAQIPAYMQKFPDHKFGYILVDGNHDKDYARQDLSNAVKIIDIGGYILFDDITEDGCSLQDVWDQFKEENKVNFIFGENHDGKGIGYARRLI